MKLSHLLIWALALLLTPSILIAAPLGRIVAVVNNEIITSLQMEKALKERGPATLSPTVRQEVLDGLIEERLLAQRAKELGLTVEPDEVETAIQDVQRQNRLTRPQLESALKQQGIDFADYRDNLRRQILRFKLLGRELQSRIEVSSREIRDDYQQHLDSYRRAPTVTLNALTFPLPGAAVAAERQRVTEQAQAARQRLVAGEDLAAVRDSLMGTVTVTGGEFGTFTEGELTDSFADAVRDLKVGEVSEVLTSATGLHLLQVTARTPGQVIPLEEVRDRIRDRLAEQKKEAALKSWLSELRQKARIEVRP